MIIRQIHPACFIVAQGFRKPPVHAHSDFRIRHIGVRFPMVGKKYRTGYLYPDNLIRRKYAVKHKGRFRTILLQVDVLVTGRQRQAGQYRPNTGMKMYIHIAMCPLEFIGIRDRGNDGKQGKLPESGSQRCTVHTLFLVVLLYHDGVHA